MTDPEMVPSAEERLDRAHLDMGGWLAKDVDALIRLLQAAFADGRASRDAPLTAELEASFKLATEAAREEGRREQMEADCALITPGTHVCSWDFVSVCELCLEKDATKSNIEKIRAAFAKEEK